MKKTHLVPLFFLFLIPKSNSQNLPENFNQIQKFVESTVQIPFMARVSDVQGTVDVMVTMNSENKPETYEVVKSQRTDCDEEALRVVKLINLRNLRTELNGKKKIIIQVPFFNRDKIILENGFVLEYFDKEKKITNDDASIKYVRRYLVDTLSGIIKSNAEIFEYKKKETVRSGFAFLKIDSTDRHQPDFLESSGDTLKIYYLSAYTNGVFPNITFNKFGNGQIFFKSDLNIYWSFFPNGRIESESIITENGKDKITTEYKWFSNGQLAYLKTMNSNDPLQVERYTAVWDTLGKQIVSDGNGMDEYYEGNSRDLVIHSGLIKDGLKIGRWTGKKSNGNVDYVENYEKGKCLSGISYLGKDTLAYTSPNEIANFNGGMSSFGKHLQSNLKYPSAAQRANISGMVYVQFVVCTDGTLCDYKVLKSVGYGCDEESLRVLALSSGNWKPGKQRGRKVKSRFTIPINYSLGR